MTDETKNDGGPAFAPNGAPDPKDPMKATYGMTLRDWFAGQALVGLLSDSRTQGIVSGLANKESANPLSYMAKSAYEFADAMIVERSK